MEDEIVKNKWKFLGMNETLDSKDGKFYISYNPGNYMVSIFDSDMGGDETALCNGQNFYILNGDFRKDYEELIEKGFDACKEFFDSKKEEYISSWSD